MTKEQRKANRLFKKQCIKYVADRDEQIVNDMSEEQREALIDDLDEIQVQYEANIEAAEEEAYDEAYTKLQAAIVKHGYSAVKHLAFKATGEVHSVFNAEFVTETLEPFDYVNPSDMTPTELREVFDTTDPASQLAVTK